MLVGFFCFEFWAFIFFVWLHFFAYLKMSGKCLMSACLISYHVYIYIYHIYQIYHISLNPGPPLICFVLLVVFLLLKCLVCWCTWYKYKVSLWTMMILMLVISSFTCYIRHIPKTDVQSQNVPVQFQYRKTWSMWRSTRTGEHKQKTKHILKLTIWELYEFITRYVVYQNHLPLP